MFNFLIIHLNSNHMSNTIQVCIRMRPLLTPIEDEVSWEVDEQSNQIRSTNTNSNANFSMEGGNISNLMLREKELKRRFAETAQQFEYNFGISVIRQYIRPSS